MNKNYIWAIIVIVLAIVAFFVYKNYPKKECTCKSKKTNGFISPQEGEASTEIPDLGVPTLMM